MKPSKPVASSEPQRPRKLFLPLFIAFILIVSVFGVVLTSYSSDTPSQDESVRVGDVEFQRTPSGRWTAQVGGVTLDLQFGPQELQTLSVGVDAGGLRAASKIYLSRDPQANLLNAVPDFYNSLKPVAPLFLACPADLPGCEDLPLKLCNEKGDGVVVVLLRSAEKDSVSFVDGCYTIEGSGLFVNQVIDRLVLEYFGVSV